MCIRDSHKDIRQVPCQRQVHVSARKDHQDSQDSEYQHKGLVLADELDVGLRVEVVSDQGRKSEQGHGYQMCIRDRI